MLETRIESRTVRLRRIAVLVLFVLFIHGVVWQFGQNLPKFPRRLLKRLI
jgi:hypothetical protein